MIAGRLNTLWISAKINSVLSLINWMENFLYVIDGYKAIPAGLERPVALLFPWVELLTGLFILLGLWLGQALGVLLLMSLSLIAIVGQAILRQLPLDNCGCFGELVHLPLRGVILVDLSVVILTVLCLVKIKRTSLFSLDNAYARSGS